MLKRIAIILIAYILCGAVGSAQNIDADTYGKWVDYVNCYYVKGYFNKKITDKKDKSFGDDFRKEYTEKYNSRLEYNDEKIIPFLQWAKKQKHEKTNNLIQFNEDKKKSFDENWDVEEVINSLIALPTDKPGKDKKSFDSFFTQEKAVLKTYLQSNLSKKDNDAKTETTESETKTDTIDSTVGGSQHNQNTEDNHLFFGGALSVMVIIGGIIIWKRKWVKKNILSFSKKRKQIPPIEDTQEIVPEKRSLQTDDLEKVFKWILNDKKHFSDFSNVILKNEQFCSLWIESSLRHPEIRKMLEKEFLPKTDKPLVVEHEGEKVIISDKRETPETGMSVLYADSIIDDFFNQVYETVNEDTLFELNLRTPCLATFTIPYDRYNRIIRRPEFLNGCEKQVLAGGQNVQILQKGEAQRNADGNWRITKRLSVIIN